MWLLPILPCLLYWSVLVEGNRLNRAVDPEAKLNSDSPPEYYVSAMTVPTAIWSGGNDGVSGPEDVNQLIPQIQNLVHNKRIPEWSHLDPLLGLEALFQGYIETLRRIREENL